MLNIDRSDSSMAFAVKANLYTFFRSFRLSPRVEFTNLPGLARWRTPVPHPWFNGMLSNRPAALHEDDIIRETIGYFQSHQVSIFTWWLEPGPAAQTWVRELSAHGFSHDSKTPGMAVELEALPASVPQPESLEIRPVEDLQALRQWVGIFIDGYGLPGEFAPPVYELLASLGLSLPNHHYLGFLDGRPAATSTLFLGAGAAGIYNIATLPEARGHGLGAAMTFYPLQQARQMGYRIGVLQSTQMGFNVYRRLGFRQVCAMEHFYWRSETPESYG